jgi:hypothetical protein
MSETQENQEKVFSLYVDRLIAKKNGYNECEHFAFVYFSSKIFFEYKNFIY